MNECQTGIALQRKCHAHPHRLRYTVALLPRSNSSTGQLGTYCSVKHVPASTVLSTSASTDYRVAPERAQLSATRSSLTAARVQETVAAKYRQAQHVTSPSAMRASDPPANDASLVSSFDLEPNPFEQSFASTDKPQGAGGAGAAGAAAHQQAQRARQQSQSQPQPQSKVQSQSQPQSQSQNQQPPPTQPTLPAAQAPQAATSAQPRLPVIPTTPGGSRRLPPLLLANPAPAPATATTAVTAANALATPSAPQHGAALGGSQQAPQVPQASAGSATPGFFINLSKTGLTPNESGLRTGLTPGILTASAPPHPPPPVSLPSGQFTPGLSSLLGMPLGQQANQQQQQQQPQQQQQTQQAQQGPQQPAQQQQQQQQQLPPHPAMSWTHSSSTAVSSDPSTTSSQNSKTRNNTSSSSSSSLAHDGSGALSLSEPAQKRQKLGSALPVKKLKNPEPAPLDFKDEQERKRKEFLERNRVAASKFRKRKKEYIKKIESDVQFYEAEYDDLSQCMDKLCGISKQTINSSLVGMLKQALLRHDVTSSLTVCNHIEQVLLQTKYVQRGGRNPRREEEEKRRMESPDADINSDSTYPRRASLATASGDGYHPTQLQSHHLQSHIKPDAGPQLGAADHATGTINNLPLVINGNTLLGLGDIQDSSHNAGTGAATMSRPTSLTSLQPENNRSVPLHEYPNSN